ncbi:FUSC family membrane protein [Salinimicrobium sp. GXAS 041]|uniref:FUSC family protein n=1 Tax=Salinimicrobium sp. GXAS 041 TaxID=3400806 RepID=UPI003C71F2C5
MDFSRGVIMAFAAVTALGAANYFGDVSVGIAMAIGALLASPSDVPGSFKRRFSGVFLAILLAILTTIIAGYARQNIYLFVPVLGFLMFSISIMAVYGFRASLIAFSGMFAVVLSMVRIPEGETMFIHALWIGAGGIWYLVFSMLYYLMNPRKPTEELLSEGFSLTSEYLKVRAALLDASEEERQRLKNELSTLQSRINEKHEMIRELVISRRIKSGRSGDARKKMLIFIELVDILELSMANPVNYEQMSRVFSQRKEALQVLKDWSFLMAGELQLIAEAIGNSRKFHANPALETFRLRAITSMNVCEKESEDPKAAHAFLVLQNMIDFKEKQQEKIISISRLMQDLTVGEDLTMKQKEAVKFITGREYNFKTLQDNLDFNSPIFRHSLRLAIVVVAGYLIGFYFELQNTYWILLTSLVIMRPGYSLTRERSKQRLLGTFIGAAIAVSIVMVTQNVIFFGVLSVIMLIFALATLQRNYRASAIFITINIVLLYSLITPDPFKVIQFRVMDTLLGAALAFLANSFLWPSWEYRGIKNFIEQSLKANSAYLEEINDYYQKKQLIPTSYKLARKQAFLAIGNLNAAFQRMTQEPLSKQKEVGTIYEIVGLNQEFLSAVASLGTFIRTHATTEASTHFKTYISAIQHNLIEAVELLENREVQEVPQDKALLKATKYFNEKYEEVLKNHVQEGKILMRQFNNESNSQLQEVQLVREQLKWLLQISENLKNQASRKESIIKSHP